MSEGALTSPDIKDSAVWLLPDHGDPAGHEGYGLIAAGLLLIRAGSTGTSCLTPYEPATSAAALL